jgi:hypothetical protein
MNVPVPSRHCMFRELTPQEEQEFRALARKWYAERGPLDEAKNVWHPVVLDELRKINEENQS